MKTIGLLVVILALVLAGCFVVVLLRGRSSKKAMRWTNLVLPLAALVVFVGLFVGEGISRSRLKKELASMSSGSKDATRLETIKARNERISWVIGQDSEVEAMIHDVEVTMNYRGSNDKS